MIWLLQLILLFNNCGRIKDQRPNFVERDFLDRTNAQLQNLGEPKFQGNFLGRANTRWLKKSSKILFISLLGPEWSIQALFW